MAEGTRGEVGEMLGELAAARDAAAPEQLALLPAPTRFDGDQAAEQQARVERHARGRPAGSQNRATREVKELCRRMFGDPLLEGFRWAQHTPESLAVELGCSKLEAFDRLEALRRDLTRYFYAPMQPIGEDGRPVPAFTLVVGGQNVQVAAGGAPPWEYQQNQSLAEPRAAEPHSEKPHEPVK